MSLKNYNSKYYRPDIDGLRAIAVLSVVFFHAFPNMLPSGFIGVDIFFVISGFLITSIILRNQSKNQFSFLDFYSRRVKRIFPALLSMMAFTFIFGIFFFTSDEFRYLGKHLLAGSTFISNFILHSEINYFDKSAELKIFLHLWSLAIEEQFYIFFPFILFLAHRLQINKFLLILFLFCLSFIANIYLINTNASFVFYNPLTRVWELLMGSLLAYMTIHKDVFTKYLRQLPFFLKNNINNILSFLGFFLLLISLRYIHNELSFPGYYGFVVVLSAFLIISAGRDAVLNKFILSNRIFVFFGLISYPLYLWHWVLLVIPKIIYGEAPGVVTTIALMVMAILISTLTYFLIEKPIRFGKNKNVTKILILLMVTVTVLSWDAFKSNGYPQRDEAIVNKVNTGDLDHYDFHNYHFESYFQCTPDSIYKEAIAWSKFKRCYQSKDNNKINIALVGDSHAEHLYIGFAEALNDKNVVNYVKNALPSINNKHYQNIYNEIIMNKDIKQVFISAYWSFRQREITENRTLYDELRATAKYLIDQGKDVYIIEDVPGFKIDPTLCKYERRLRNYTHCSEPLKNNIRRNKEISDNLSLLANEIDGLEYVGISGSICDSKNCHMNKDGQLLYRDGNHLNINGSKYLGKYIIDKLKSKNIF